MGLEIKDHTGDAFDYGLPLKVVTSQPTLGLTKESVLETIKPTIYWLLRPIKWLCGSRWIFREAVHFRGPSARLPNAVGDAAHRSEGTNEW